MRCRMRPRIRPRMSLECGASAIVAVIGVAVAGLGGCETTPPASTPAPPAADAQVTTNPSQAPPTAPAKAPAASAAASASYIEAVTAQQARLRKLQFLEGRGIIEIRWTDAKGKHFEQGDVDMYLMPPWKTAFNISKLGQRLAWIGSDEEAWWIFRLDETPSYAERFPWPEPVGVGGVGGGSDDGLAGDAMSIVSPDALLAMAGLTRFPPITTVRLKEEEEAKRLVVEMLPTAKGHRPAPRFRWTLNAATKLPLTVELLDEVGGVVATGRLEDYAPAAIDGMSVGEHPLVPKRIAIARTDGQGELRLALNAPTARGERVQAKFFRFQELLAALQPKEVRTRVRPMGEPISFAPPGDIGDGAVR